MQMIYLLTFENWFKFGNCDFGIMSVHASEQEAEAALQKIVEQQDPKFKQYDFSIKVVDRNAQTTLFKSRS